MTVPDDVLTRWQTVSPYVIWAGAAVAAVVIGIAVPHQYLTWLPVALAAAVIATFAIQLGIQRKEGFVQRVMLSVGGAIVVLAAATGILALIDLLA